MYKIEMHARHGCRGGMDAAAGKLSLSSEGIKQIMQQIVKAYFDYSPPSLQTWANTENVREPEYMTTKSSHFTML